MKGRLPGKRGLAIAGMAMLVAVVGPGGCGLGQGKVCTAIGCRAQASITVASADGATPAFAVTLVVDGRAVTCSAPLQGSAGTAKCDDPTITVDHRELMDCQETQTGTAVGVSCHKNGKFEQIITVPGTPARLDVVLLAGATQAAHRVFDLAYVAISPNGAGCDPECRQASVIWALP